MLEEITCVWSWWWNTSNTTDETFRNIFTTIIAVFLLFWLLFTKRKNKEQPPLPSPPGPRGLPFIGYLPFLGSNIQQSFKELASIYGPIFRLHLGTKECIVITSPSLVKEMVRDNNIIFDNRGDPTVATRSVLFGTTDIAFSDYGPEWRKMRKIFVSQLMSNLNLDASYHLRKKHMKSMIHKTYTNTGELVDIGELAFQTLLSSVLSMLWGETLKGNEGSVIDCEFRAVISEISELLGIPNVSDLFPLLSRFDFQGIERKMKEASRKCRKIYDSVINISYSTEYKSHKDILRHLLQLAESEDPSVSLTLPQVKAILQDTVSGGTDTTSAMVEWAMAEMLQHPTVLKKAQEETTQIVGLNNAVEESDLPKLKYLNAVVKETLRLHPSLPLLIPRCPSKPATIGGYHVPKNARVFLNAYAIQRDPQHWEDPLVFQPERFLSGSGSRSSADKVDYLGNQFHYIPFGSGRRTCPGIPLAERMSVLLLASLVHSFEWKLPNGTVEVDFSEKSGIVMKKSKPLIVTPSPRLSNLELYVSAD